MKTPDEQPSTLPSEQESIRSRCFHPRSTWIHMDPDAGEGLTIHEMIEAQAATNPDRIAVVSPGRSLTYASLNQEANRFARAILAQAAPADAAIAICCSLGAAQLVAILAVLKAGRFFVSLAASDPPTRNRAILTSTHSRLIVTDDANWTAACTLARDEDSVLNVEASHQARAIDNLGQPVRGDALVRIALTSGSTGEPKGIMQTHRTTLYGAITRNNAVHLCASDRMLLVTPGLTDLLRPLLVGGTVYLFDIRTDELTCLERWTREEHLTVFRSTPSVFRRLVVTLGSTTTDAVGPKSVLVPSLRVIESMGEPVSKECVLLYQKHFSSQCIFINFLGAKEVLDYRIYYVDHATQVAEGFLPAGYPLGGARVMLLDEAGKAVAPDGAGEISVQSGSMSPGYWRRTDLTAERFRNDPADGGTRTYRTGDLGRLVPDGCLIHLGRRDSMVKIRGHRVDVAFVEQTLRDLEPVTDVAVIVKESDHQDPQLIAFIVASAAQSSVEQDIRRALAESLPGFMIPAAFVFLETMPTTAMGKIDRERLRSLSLLSARRTGSTDLPKTSIEKAIAAIWAEVLDREQVERHHNFFDIGGNSLMVMQVVSRLQQRFEVELPLSVLFDMPTVQELALHVSEVLDASGRAGVVSRPQLQSRKTGGRLTPQD